MSGSSNPYHIVPVTEYIGQVGATGQNVLIDGLAAWSWSVPVGQAANVSYSFNYPLNDGSITSVAFTATQQANAVLAMQQFAKVANISFTQNDTGWNIGFGYGSLSSLGADIRGMTRINSDGNGKFTGPNSIVMHDVLGHMNAFGSGTADGFGFLALMREIGHAVGLKDAAGTASGPAVPNDMQNLDWTVMTYTNGAVVLNKEVTGLMYGDILALQYLYGKNTNYNAGDTVYDFSHKGAFALWDGGGNDTLFAGNATGIVNLDLRDEGGKNQFNQVLMADGLKKLVIAKDANIENAIGGNFGDRVIGNSLNNYLYGGGGNDFVNGGPGNDVLIGGKDISDITDGDDRLLGAKGNDIIFGNSGNDTLYGGADVLTSLESGNDLLFGGLGNDLIYGHDGDDTLIGGGGQDSLYGGLGNDVYGVGWNNYVDIIYHFEGKSVAGGDILRVMTNVNNSGIKTAADVIARMTTDGNHSWLDLGEGNGVLIAWALPTQFGADDIIVVDNLV